MWKASVFTLIAFLSGCASTPEITYNQLQYKSNITWHISSPSEVARACGKPKPFYREEGELKVVRGCARWGEGNCHIYTVAPESKYDKSRLSTLGHELLHCFVGQFH